jgi:hypothetical protein
MLLRYAVSYTRWMCPDLVTQMAVMFTDSLSAAAHKALLIAEYKLFRVMIISMLWTISSVVSAPVITKYKSLFPQFSFKSSITSL